eukprot:gene18596-biopygen17420
MPRTHLGRRWEMTFQASRLPCRSPHKQRRVMDSWVVGGPEFRCGIQRQTLDMIRTVRRNRKLEFRSSCSRFPCRNADHGSWGRGGLAGAGGGTPPHPLRPHL